jgi:glycosyltransferase involved in cell wall biosynthesis
MFELIERVRRVHPVKVLVAESGFEADYADLRNVEVELVRTKTSPYKVLWMLSTVRHRMLNEGGIFHLHHAVLNWAALGNRRRNYLCTFHGWYGPELDPSPFPKRWARAAFLGLTTRLYRRMDRVTAVSHALRDELEARYGVAGAAAIPNGVDVSRFSPSGEDDGYILFVGRLIGQKRPLELVRLAADVGMPLRVVGRGPLKGALAEDALKRGVELDLMEGLSEDDLARAYRRCSFFATASGWEGMTLTILEAAACGKPVLAYDVASNREVVQHGATGYLASDHEGLARHGRELAKDEGLRRELGIKARQRAEKEFSWDVIADRYLAIYADIAHAMG